MWGALAFSYHILSRLAYVLWVGRALHQQDRHQRFTRVAGGEAGFLRFRRIASRIMNNDGVSFVVLVLVTRDTLRLDLPRGAVIATGVVLATIGVGIKLWAAASLGSKAYYWHNFFVPSPPPTGPAPGPYRYISNPMYTLGYLQTYGLALMFGSLPALIASAFDQAAVLLFNHLVERPHYAALLEQASPDPSRSPGV
jgi:protein-S-isoprenylcysteine O-methyltransferase Ste14